MAKTIAIVEDDPDQRSNYVDALTKKGYNVVAYSDRKEALEGLRGKGWKETNTVKDMLDASDRTWDTARKEVGVETQTVKEPNGRVKAWEWKVPELNQVAKY